MTLTYTLKYKIGANLLAIGGNVAELHHRSENLLSEEVHVYLHPEFPLVPKIYMICRLFSCNVLRV